MRTLSIKRSMDTADIGEVTELLHAAEAADGHHPLADHQWLDLVDGGRPGFAGLVAWEPGHDHPIAYAQVSRSNTSWGLELVIHPHHRYDALAIGPELLGGALDIVKAEGGGHVHWWVFEPTTAHDKIAGAVGLHRGRTLCQMRVALPIDDHADVTTRPFVIGRDEAEWLQVNNRAFAQHPEQGGWDLETLTRRQREPWFDPEGFLLHEVGGHLAAFCWTKIHPSNGFGEIYVIAVDPAFHGRGLGRALTVAGLESLARRGATTGMLYVDGDNVAAVSLYESLRFVTHHHDGAYTGEC